MKKVLILFCLILSAAAGAAVIEDFSDVSDWYVDMLNSDALDGAISSVNGDGALYYELSTQTSNDWIMYKRDFDPALDLSDPNLALQFNILIPDDPDMFVQIRLTDSSGKFIEHYLGSGSGEWLSISASLTDMSFWADYGNPPDLSDIVNIRFEINGDVSANYTTGTVYVSDIVANEINYTVVEDFEQLGWWATSTGPNAASASVVLDSAEAQQGAYCAAFTYGLSTEVGSDFVRLYNDRLSVDMSGAQTFDFLIKLPEDPHSFVQLKIYDAAGGFLEYTFGEGSGQWEFYSLSLANDFADYGTNPALTNVNLIIFEVNGDISDQAVTDTLYVDYITLNKQSVDCNLTFDSNGDCVVTLADFAAFASEWLSCGWEFPGLCD
jgi:hypothetical protein